MDISRYLAELIRNCEEVVVPGFGTFLKEEIPARYDRKSKTFFPPTEKIGFKSAHRTDDTLLHYIALQEEAPLKTIQDALEEYVSNLNELLHSTESIKIDALGTFAHTKNGFSFIADIQLASTKYYGLKPQEEIPHLYISPQEEVIEQAETIETVLEPIEDEEEEYEPAHKRNFLLIAALVLGLIAVLQVVYPDLLTYTSKKTEPMVLADTLTQKKDTLTKIDTVQTADTSILRKDSIQIILNKEEDILKNRFEIIIAAFGKRAETEVFLKQLESRGIKAYTLPNKPKELIKISVGGFNDEKAAATELKRIQAELSKSAWIYRVKPIKNQDNVSTTN
ncbi:MAG: hypothetical protein RI924_188 [Bacteroidota bacterium]|jgi:nucleoid DNA-binding protein